MIVEFLSALVVEKLAGKFWRLRAPFHARCGGDLVVVPDGYTTDLATVPRVPIIFLAFGAIGEKAATLHDFLYGQGAHPRSWCDEVLRDALAAEGVSWWRRQAMYRAVRIAGRAHYAGAL